jgi:quinol monooxygenase YgiN
MGFVVAAVYRTKEGEEERIAEILRTMTEPSRSEPGCLQYQIHRSTEDPRTFLLYEHYVDEAGYEAHQATPHFQAHILGDAVPRLERRDRSFYEILD